MTITGGTALSKDEIDRMVKEAEAFAAEDHTRREAAEARNQADQLTYQVDTFLTDNGDKITDADKAELTAKNDELKQLLKDESAETDALRSASDALLQVWQRAGQSMHEQAAQSQAIPLGRGEGCALVERGIAQQRGAARNVRMHDQNTSCSPRYRPFDPCRPTPTSMQMLVRERLFIDTRRPTPVPGATSSNSDSPACLSVTVVKFSCQVQLAAGSLRIDARPIAAGRRNRISDPRARCKLEHAGTEDRALDVDDEYDRSGREAAAVGRRPGRRPGGAALDADLAPRT